MIIYKSVKEKGIDLICFGTGVMAEEAMDEPKIADAVICFVDNDIFKQEKNIIIKERVYPIVAPEAMKQIIIKNEKKIAIMIASSHFKVIEEQINQLLENLDVDYYIYPLLRLNFTTNSKEFYQKRLVDEAVKEYRDVLRVKGYDNISSKIEIQNLRERMNDNYMKLRGTSIIPRMMIIPTTKCNMRCRDCSSLLPYFKKPKDSCIDQIIKDLDVFFSVIDECIRLTIGGEPFLYPHLSKLLDYLIVQPKLGGILLITNSTIIPNEQVLKHMVDEKVYVEISDYGHIEKMSQLVACLEQNNIKFEVLSNQKWTDMGNSEFRDKDSETLRYEYLNCDQGRVIKAIHEGRLYICARSSRMHALGVYSSEHDWIELNDKVSIEDIQKELMRIYFSDYADACNYCDCGRFPTKVIQAGVQLGCGFEKSEFTIVKDQNMNV